MLYIAHNPGNASLTNASTGLFSLIPPQSPFGPALTAAPSDYTMTLNFVGGGLGGVKTSTLGEAKGIAIDAEGNLWIPNPATASVTELTNLGAPAAGSSSTTIHSTTPFAPYQVGGFTGGGAFGIPNNVAVDLGGNIWVADETNCLVELSSGGVASGPFTSPCPSGSGVTVAVAPDLTNTYANGVPWVAGEAFITSVNPTTGSTLNAPYTNLTSLAPSLAPDYTGHIWYMDNGTSLAGALSASTGTLYAEASDANKTQGGRFAMGTGPGGSLSMWVLEGTPNDWIQPITLGSSPTLAASMQTAALNSPNNIAADGASNFYFTNNAGNLAVVSSAEKTLSPSSTGYLGGSALTPLDAPAWVAVDQSGNVWVVNANNYWHHANAPAGTTYYNTTGINASNVTEFVGLAVPVNPVFAADAKSGSYATKP